jgi:two-component sensor histidine kinase
MTLHELTTNAAKYGALSDEAGRVDITWRVATTEGGARRLAMEWRESGGPAVAVPRRKGFGTRLINGGISHELGGTVHLDFDAAGLSCVMNVPLDEQDRFTSFRKGSGQSLSAA